MKTDPPTISFDPGSLTDSSNYEGVCRTAPATPGHGNETGAAILESKIATNKKFKKKFVMVKAINLKIS